jgi:prepilin-type processing-associated H-X9-DG protein/prepilin-type N-terminal cleavage/methylation domain-containing protein
LKAQESSYPRALLPAKRSTVARERRDRGDLVGAAAFNLIELLVVLTIIGLLASLILTAVARAKSAGRQTSCISNLKQLQLAWLIYAYENEDRLPINRARRQEFDMVGIEGGWVLGNPKLDKNDAMLREGSLFPYAGSTAIYRCPADSSTVRGEPSRLRNRSFSMNMWLNSDLPGSSDGDDFSRGLNLGRLSRVDANGASRLFVFIDEHPASIDDGVFIVANPALSITRLIAPVWGAFPAERHGGGGNVSYADGHVEQHRWRWHRDVQHYSGGATLATNTNDLADLEWLQNQLPTTP